MVKVYFETQGCSANVADTEQMAGLLKAADFEITDSSEQADVIIFNTCTVKTPSENSFFKRLQELKDGYKIVIIAGCIAQADSKNKKLKGHPLIGTKSIHKIVEVVEEALHENIVREISNEEIPPLDLPVHRKNPIVEIIPINRGCLGYCTFCKTKSARGNLISYPVEDIVKRAKKAVQEGVKEIWLTSQDTGCYGFDIQTNLPTLLGALTEISGDFKIRVGMMNPDHMPKIQNELIQIYQHPKVFKFLHLPVQAGDNSVLENMKRLYTVEQYRQQIKAFKKAMPNITIMTDVIVGFPGETEEQYWQTLNLIRETSPDAVNISRFWPRPNTPAARMKNKVEGAEIKRRSKVLTDIFHNIARLQNEKWQDWQGEIIIDEKGKKPGQWIGRNEYYKQIILETNQTNNVQDTSIHYKLGEKVQVKVTRTDTFALYAEDLNKEKRIRLAAQEQTIKLQVINN